MQRMPPWSCLAVVVWGGLALGGRAQPYSTNTPIPPVAPPLVKQGAVLDNLRPEPGPAAATNDEARIAAREEVVVRFHEAVAIMLGGDYAKSIPLLESVIQVKPSLINAWTALGYCYMKVGRVKDAETLWKQLLSIDPNLALIHKALGQLASLQGDMRKAEDYYRASLKLDPDQYETRLEFARLLRRQSRPEEAITELRRLLREDPKRNDVVLELARALLDVQQYQEALPLWEHVTSQAPQNELYLTTLADIQLHSGLRSNAMATARKVLAQNATNINALMTMADAQEYGEQPAAALPYLKALGEIPGYPGMQQSVRLRFIMLTVRLHQAAPLNYTLDEAIRQAEAYCEDDPGNVGVRLLLAELNMINGSYQAAEKIFQSILRTDNPNNRRVHNGLFELYLAMPDFSAAEKELKAVESFNPLDPYLHYSRAQFAAAQGNYRQAYRELDALEAAGRRGAVAVLLYHGLTTSEWSPIISVNRFREQLLALRQAGFTFITPTRLPAYFADRITATNPPSDAPERAVIITFDDARQDAMRLGSAVSRELNVPFAMNVPVGFVEKGYPFQCSWDQLRQYERAYGWELGSHMLEAHMTQRLGTNHTLIYPLCNRVWLTKENRLETEAEYHARIWMEYRRSRELMEQKLGHPVVFVAYPRGDIGQETRSDVPDAIECNLKAAQANYQTGFIQSEFCYAVNGDNPLLYKRHELDREAVGAKAVESILYNHPVYLAWRLRAEFAAQEGKIYASTRELKKMKRNGYPLQDYTNVEDYVHERLTGARSTPVNISRVTKGPFNLDIKNPYVGARGDFSRDSLESRIWRLQGLGGLNLTPNLTFEGRAGGGQMKQPFSYTNFSASGGPDISLTERTVGVAPSIKFPNGWTLLGELSGRQFNGDVPTNMNGDSYYYDKTFLPYAVEAQGKLLLPLDLTARWEHDVVPAAGAAVKGTTCNAGALNANYTLFDWWTVYGNGARYMFSDSNTRSHLGLGARWLVYEPPGLHLGLLYTFATSDEANPDYWTPYKLNSFYLEALLRRTYRRTYYNLGARYGIAKESMRPDVEPQYQATLRQMQQDMATARQNKWSQQSINNLQRWYNDLLANPPEEPTWHPVLSLVASFRTKLGKHWELNGEISYNTLPDYNYLALLGGIKYKF